ncbi:UNVERIFIED_CONTAM: chemotaxis protein methyltransferase CheR [Acetivibrio alkalicellulosi]
MSVYVDKCKGVIHISVTGELEEENELKLLICYLNKYADIEIHITFLDANIIPGIIVEQLLEIQKYEKNNIYVIKNFLYSYLYGLGIQCLYVNKMTQKKSLVSSLVLNESKLDYLKVRHFLESINLNYGYDYTQYQIESIIRRIKITMIRYGIKDFEEFQKIILTDQEAFEQLFLDFSINTTEFFRNPEVYTILREKVLPYLKSYSHIRIWSVGCSNGKEPYSLAMLLNEQKMLHKTQIYATDINPYIIEEAKNGFYSLDTIITEKNNYTRAGGTKDFYNYFDIKGNCAKVSKFLSEKILFFQHSLLEKGILNEFQLILCRNVMIYFDRNLQKKVLEYFYNSLDISGFLVLGKSESILPNEGVRFFSNYNEDYRIYKRRLTQK